MKKRNRFGSRPFTFGELYLFNRTDRRCPVKGSLFGTFSQEKSGIIYLESSSIDLRHFRLWHSLPKTYRYYRTATRAELRDYFFNLAFFECRMTNRRNKD